MKGYYQHLAIAIILIMAFAIRIPFFSVPPERDEGTYATVTKVVLDGGTPYKDVFTTRAPGVYYIYALFIKVFGERTEALRIGSAIFATLTTFIIFKFASDLYGNGIGLLAALLYALFSSGPLIQGSFANCEAFMMLPAVAATYLFYLGYKRQVNHYFVLAGIFSGAAYLIKEAVLPNFLIFFLFLPVCQKDVLKIAGLGLLLKRYVYLIIGFAIPIITFFLYLAFNNALYDYLQIIYSWNKGYGQYDLDVFLSRFVSRGVYLLGREYSFLWLTSAVAIIVMAVKGRNIDNAYVLLWTLSSFAGVCLGSMFWPHYFIQMIPSLSIAAAYGLAGIYKGFKDGRLWIKIMSLAPVPLLLLSIGYAVYTDYRFYLIYTPDEISTNIYGSDIFVNSKKVAAYLKEHTVPSDYIYQNRWEPEIYFLAQRRSPSKYIDHISVSAAPNPVKAINELRDDLFTKNPKYIVWYQPRPGEVPEFVVWPIVQLRYILETEIGGIKLYRLKVNE